MSIRLRQSIWVLCLLLVHCMHKVVSDSDTFIRFCRTPGHHGKGELEVLILKMFYLANHFIFATSRLNISLSSTRSSLTQSKKT
ncbi:hypothetical protein ANCCAN_02619 [Ancylostoma caninum]|uniref:Secreted protein n=1 Tax=Ancylostoma caninum TaxID=29170 RepID=A0A368H677_ANCCA|nr:hypothetical protein ANCCAN_02619 [Ancylostoma caninum]